MTSPTGTHDVVCPRCGGYGVLIGSSRKKQRCDHCDGTGHLPLDVMLWSEWEPSPSTLAWLDGLEFHAPPTP